MLPPAVLWIDPGKMTGAFLYCTSIGYSVPPDRDPKDWAVPFFRVDEFPFITAGEQIEHACAWWRANLWIGWEHFNIRPKTPPADAHHAIEMIGVARMWATRYRCKILTPAEQEQRKVATRTMLEAIGWWLPGKDDAQSAAQHMLGWMLRTGNVPDREAMILAALRA